jgi:hypothetical protein
LEFQKRGKECLLHWPLATGNWQLSLKSKSPVVFDLPGFGYVLFRLMLSCSGHQRVDRRQGSPMSCIQQQQQLHAQVAFPENIGQL